MKCLQQLETLKGAGLKMLCAAIGVRVTGVKKELRDRIATALTISSPTVFAAREKLEAESARAVSKWPSSSSSLPPLSPGIRVLSIDMGLRNMAYALVSLEPCQPLSLNYKVSKTEKNNKSNKSEGRKTATPAAQTLAYTQVTGQEGRKQLTKGEQQENRPRVCLHEWDTISLIDEYFTNTGSTTTITSTGVGSSLSPEAIAQTLGNGATGDPFAPPHMAKAALALVTRRFLPLQPTHVLIERQRFRSAGQSAVQEWTVRVNMLEAMLYAVFTTLNFSSYSLSSLPAINTEATPISYPKRSSSSFEYDEMPPRSQPQQLQPIIIPINPKALASFTTMGGEMHAPDTQIESDRSLGKRRGRIDKSKVIKEAKILRVAEWLQASPPEYLAVDEEKSSTAAHMRRRFLEKVYGNDGSAKKGKGATVKTVKFSGEKIGMNAAGKTLIIEKTGVRKGTMAEKRLVKVDDLADSLFQAVAWLTWEQNKERLRQGGVEAILGDEKDRINIKELEKRIGRVLVEKERA